MTDKHRELSPKSNNPRSIETPLGNIVIDYDLLGQELEESSLSVDEKKEFIDCICWIMLSFVDLGFGIEPAQQALLARQSEIDNGSPQTLPFVEMIMASELTDEFKLNSDSKPTTTKKEKVKKGVEI